MAIYYRYNICNRVTYALCTDIYFVFTLISRDTWILWWHLREFAKYVNSVIYIYIICDHTCFFPKPFNYLRESRQSSENNFTLFMTDLFFQIVLTCLPLITQNKLKLNWYWFLDITFKISLLISYLRYRL